MEEEEEERNLELVAVGPTYGPLAVTRAILPASLHRQTHRDQGGSEACECAQQLDNAIRVGQRLVSVHNSWTMRSGWVRGL
jgi:hypothetical protein